MSSLGALRAATWLIAWTVGMTMLAFGRGQVPGLFTIGHLLFLGCVLVQPFKPREPLVTRLSEKIPARSAILFAVGFIALMMITIAMTSPTPPAGTGISTLGPYQIAFAVFTWIMGVASVLWRYANERQAPPADTTR